MDERVEQVNENTAPERDAREVVLEYVPAQRGVVECYVQPTPLPGRRTRPVRPDEDEDEDEEQDHPRRRHRVRRIILSTVALLLVGSVFLSILYGSGVIGAREQHSESSGLQRRDSEESTAAGHPKTLIPRYPNGDGTRLRYYPAGGDVLSIQQIYAQVNPCTVTVAAERSQTTLTIGTGVIFTPDGYILTNAHVVAGGRSCMVVLDTGYSFDVKLVGMDEEKDLAVIKIEQEDLEEYVRAMGELPYATFGDSDMLSVGDPVYAIGNPLGVELRGTLTDGIVSAINRDVVVDGVRMTLIQTNAALNNGNSGGPLINQYGQVVGINAMKKGSTADVSVEGLGFAIPISSVAYMVNDLIAYGEIRGEPIMGITVLTKPVTLPDGDMCLEIEEITPTGAGEAAGLQPGDYLLRADGEAVTSVEDLLRIRRYYLVGEGFDLEIMRDGERFHTRIVLTEGR